MNLEIDTEAEMLVGEAARVFAGVHGWRDLVDAGWGDLGGAVVRGELDLGTAATIYREAGRVLRIEQLVTSGFLLPALGVPVDEHPGVVLGDGRSLTLDTAGPTDGFCFGVEELPVAHRLRRDEAGRLWVGTCATVDVEPVAALSRAVGRVAPRGSWEETVLDIDEQALEQIERATILVHCAALLGCVDRTLGMTCEYVLERVQFDVPIGSFQSVKHRLADVFAAATVAWNALLSAVAEGGGDPQHRAHVARLLTVDAAMAAASAAAQFHGGVGCTWEHDLHHFLKAILDGCQRFGSRDDIARTIGRSFREASC